MTLYPFKLAVWRELDTFLVGSIRKFAYEGLFGKPGRRDMNEPTVIKLKMPGGWKPGRCHYEGNITLSCPMSPAGCWVHKAENCPLAPLVKEEKCK